MKLRFSLRTLALVFTLICLLIGAPVGYIRYRANQQRYAVGRLGELGVQADWPIEDNDKPSWLTRQARRWIDRDAFRQSRFVRIGPSSQNLDEAVLLVTRLEGLVGVMGESSQLSDAHLHSLATIPSLTTLSIAETKFSVDAIRAAMRKRDWERIHLPTVQFDDAVLAELGQMKNLTAVCFDASKCSESALAGLGHCSALREIYVTRCDHCDAIARASRKLTKVREIIIMKSTLREAQFREFGELGVLTSLHFWECVIEGEKFEFLGNNRALTHLEFGKTRVSTKVLDGVEKLPKLSILFVDAPFSDADAERLSRLPAITLLGVSSSDIGDDGLQQFANSRTLKTLVLSRDTKCTRPGIGDLQEKRPIKVVVGELSDGLLHEPGGNIIPIGKKAKK